MLLKKLSPLNKRRIDNFKKNKRGYYSFWILFFLFGISLLGEFWLNDKPLVVYYKNSFYFPVLKDYPETTFGGDFETATDYQDPYLVDLIDNAGWIIWPPFPYYYDTIIKDLNVSIPSPPSKANILGTDDQARDVFSRVVYGFRLSIIFGLALTSISIVLGIIAGALQGYLGGWLDLLFQRFMEIWDSIPMLYLLIILSSVIDHNFLWLLLIMSLFGWMNYVGVVRAEFLKTRNYDYVQSAKALGLSHTTIIFRHILPNAMVATLTFLPFNLSSAITTLAALDFLGFGLPSPSPSLGELIQQGRNNLHAPWLGLTGFFSLSILLSLLVFLGEAIRDAFDYNR